MHISIHTHAYKYAHKISIHIHAYCIVYAYMYTVYIYTSSLQVLKRDRFSLLMRFLHLNDNSYYRRKGEPGHDPLVEAIPHTPCRQLSVSLHPPP